MEEFIYENPAVSAMRRLVDGEVVRLDGADYEILEADPDGDTFGLFVRTGEFFETEAGERVPLAEESQMTVTEFLTFAENAAK